jgi:hypothetical protein
VENPEHSSPPPTAPEAPPMLAYSTSAAPEETALRSVDLLAIALKLLGVYEIVQGLPALAYVPAFFVSGRTGLSASEALSWLLPSSFPLALGVILLVGARWIAIRLLGGMRDRERTLRPPGKRLQAIAFSVAGVLLVADGGIELIRVLARTYLGEDQDVSVSYVIEDGQMIVPAILPGSAQIIAGVFLFFGANALAAFWHRIRTQPNPISGGRSEGGNEPAAVAADVTSADAARPSARRSG